MTECTEFAVFRVKPENIQRAIQLSESIFLEMNSSERVITASKVLIKTDAPEEICWHLIWVSPEAAKDTTAKWPSFPSTEEFQSLVIKDLYYGHFVDAHQ